MSPNPRGPRPFNPNRPGDDLRYLGEVETEIEKELNRQRALRSTERQLNSEIAAMNQGPAQGYGGAGTGGVPQAVENQLKKILPEFLIPGNLGHVNKVTWNHWFQVDFDFGNNPTIQKNISRATQNLQVTAEAAFLLMALQWNPWSDSTSGLAGPWNIEIRDRQSSRQFNGAPVPLQMLGRRSQPTVFPVPMLLWPNAIMDFTMDSYQPIAQTTVGSGKHEIMCFGYRIRPQDADKIMSLIYAKE
jgi:hypothetical protein